MKRWNWVLSALLLAGLISACGPGAAPSATNTPGATIAPTAVQTPAPQPTAAPEETAASEHTAPADPTGGETDTDEDKIAFMTEILCDYLKDGGSVEVKETYSAATRMDNEFYSGVCYFYLTRMEMAAERLGDAAVTGKDEPAEYVLTEEEVAKIFTSFFGSEFKGEVAQIFDEYVADGSYRFMKSDGPFSTAMIADTEILSKDEVKVTATSVVDYEDGSSSTWGFTMVLRPDDASMFSYTIGSMDVTYPEGWVRAGGA